MDLRNLETTSTYAIEAVYRDYWFQIPEKYRLLEKAQRPIHGNYDMEFFENLPEHKKPNIQKTTPLSYRDVEKQEEKDDYDAYCSLLNNKDQYFDLQPFFDPQLDFENRLHYKLTGINYPNRKNPWFIITWNCGNGLLKSSISNRRFDTADIEVQNGEKVKFDFINSDLDLTLCYTSNSLQALFELQEYLRVSRREKHVVNTRKHSILGSFPVSLFQFDTSISKMERAKSTLCTLTLSLKLNYIVIGNIRSAEQGIIKEIHAEIDENGSGVGNHVVLARDIINENT